MKIDRQPPRTDPRDALGKTASTPSRDRRDVPFPLLFDFAEILQHPALALLFEARLAAAGEVGEKLKHIAAVDEVGVAHLVTAHALDQAQSLPAPQSKKLAHASLYRCARCLTTEIPIFKTIG